ncbi:hypothetical protein ACNS7O_18725 (plasmid) [Haloferacaceae archaeon DSL9]
MTDQYLTTVLDEARQTIESHPQVGYGTEQPLHEHLRFAVLRLLENEAEDTHTGESRVPGITVGYGNDAAMFDHWRDEVEWWTDIEPQEHCTRFRIFYEQLDQDELPRRALEVMTALGAWRVWEGTAAACGSYDHRGRREAHFLLHYNHPIEEHLARLVEPNDPALAPDGGWVATRDTQSAIKPEIDTVSAEPSADELAPRMRRACDEEMDVSLLKKGGVYEVHSESGNFYDVDVAAETCTCLDWQRREPEGGCKHMRRVDIEIDAGNVPRPDGRLPRTESEQQPNSTL